MSKGVLGGGRGKCGSAVCVRVCVEGALWGVVAQGDMGSLGGRVRKDPASAECTGSSGGRQGLGERKNFVVSSGYIQQSS